MRRLVNTPATERRRNALLMAVFDGAILLVVVAGVALAVDFDFALFALGVAVIAISLLAIVSS